MNLDTDPPMQTHSVALYIAHLWRSKSKLSTIRSKLSAISYFHNIKDMKDPCKSYMIKQILKGTGRCLPTSKPKLLPITKPLLHNMIQCMQTEIASAYDRHLYKALFIFAYYCCLRAGEAVASNTKEHTIKVEQIEFVGEQLHLTFLSYKHSIDITPIFSISKLSSPQFCPIELLKQYLEIRPPVNGPLFIHKNRSPVTRSNYSTMIKTVVSKLGLYPKKYNTHSFRIGRATDLAMTGASADTIKQTGRWASSAYLKYIRLDTFSVPTQ